MTSPTKRVFLSATAAFLLSSVPYARATISGEVVADRLKDQAGVAIPNTSVFLLVASTSDTTFSDINLTLQVNKSITVGSVLGTDEVVIFKSTVTGTGTLDKVFGLDYTLAAFNGLVAPGERFALLWFPTLNSTATNLPLGARYGFYDGGAATTANQADADSSATDGGDKWLLPNDGVSAYFPQFFTKDGSNGAGSASAAVAGNGIGTVVPEPSSGLLGLLGCLGFLGRHRRRA